MSDEYILIVDDDSDIIRNLPSIYLENEGYSYIKCDNALKVLDVLEKSKVVLILLPTSQILCNMMILR